MDKVRHVLGEAEAKIIPVTPEEAQERARLQSEYDQQTAQAIQDFEDDLEWQQLLPKMLAEVILGQSHNAQERSKLAQLYARFRRR